MEYSKLKEDILEIANIANTVPEPFREKCFEILLSRLLAPMDGKTRNGSSIPANDGIDLQPDEANSSAGSSVTWNATVRVFMRRTGITEAQLEKAFYCEDGDFHFLIEPSSSTVSGGAIQCALLLAARNGIVSGNFEVDPEDARSLCQEKGYYDATNFWKTFKSGKNKSFFAGELKAQGEPRKLTAAGQEELGELIRSLVG